MSTTATDSAGIRIPPPLYFFICLGGGLLLEIFFPLNLLQGSRLPLIIVGGLLVLISCYFAISGFMVLIKNKTTFDTAKSTVTIVNTGAFRFSRNPLYLSLLLLLTAIAVVLFSLWVFLTIPILFALFLIKAVKPEEAYLTQKFGEKYLTYKASVRRWI